jgi:hypothetical protein
MSDVIPPTPTSYMDVASSSGAGRCRNNAHWSLQWFDVLYASYTFYQSQLCLTPLDGLSTFLSLFASANDKDLVTCNLKFGVANGRDVYNIVKEIYRIAFSGTCIAEVDFRLAYNNAMEFLSNPHE